MPRRKKRGRKRRRQSKQSALDIGRLSRVGVVPDQVVVKLKYSEIFARAPGLPDDSVSYRGNSVFDPNLTGVGSQPQGFDEWSAFYGEYRVYASKIFIQLVNGNTVGINASVIPSTDAIAPVFNVSATSAYARFRFGSGTAGNPRLSIKNYQTTRSIWGRPVKNEDNFASPIGGNPVNQWYWHLTTRSIDNTTNLNYDVMIRVVYWVEFSKRKQLQLS